MTHSFFKKAEKSKQTSVGDVYTPWVEKYRPRTVGEVQRQEEVVRTLNNALVTGNLPHLLFYGPPGTGKTSTILAIGHQLFGPTHFKARVLELNASDERGISIIRTKVKNFAQFAVSSGGGGGEYLLPPYKLLILDEADSMTQEAQSALRRIMEDYSHITRFCLICNYVSRIIEPLASRCAKFRFKSLEGTSMEGRLKFICEKENLTCSDNVISDIIRCSEGDLRKGITYLQSASQLFGKDLSNANINDISGKVPTDAISGLIQVMKSNSFENLQSVVTNLSAEGYAGNVVISQLFDQLLALNERTSKNDSQLIKVSDMQLTIMAEKFAEADQCLLDGADEYLQVLSACTAAMVCLNSSP